MAQVKLAEHQGVDAEGTATKRYGPKEAFENAHPHENTLRGSFAQSSTYLSVITKRI